MRDAGARRAWVMGPGRELALDVPRVMGIVNVTPDSFSDGGVHAGVEEAARAAERMVREGADVIDVGGESTRPGAARVIASEQIERVVPVVRAIRERCGGGPLMTIDTTLSEVARAALDAGADAINDVSAGLEDAGMLRLASERRCGVVLMHRLAAPGADVYSTRYAREPEYEGGVVASVVRFLRERAEAALAAGVARECVVVDPGLGFGKSVAQNLELIARTREIAALGFPVLSGLSRKSFVGAAADLAKETAPSERVHASLGLSVVHLLAGAAIFRVHDVREHVGALRAAAASQNLSKNPRNPGT